VFGDSLLFVGKEAKVMKITVCKTVEFRGVGPYLSYLCHKPATQVAKWRAQGRNSQREQKGR